MGGGGREKQTGEGRAELEVPGDNRKKVVLDGRGYGQELGELLSGPGDIQPSAWEGKGVEDHPCSPAPVSEPFSDRVHTGRT